VQTKRMEANAEGDRERERERERESNEKKRKNGARVSETRFELAGHLRDFMARERENHCSLFRRASRKKTKKENKETEKQEGSQNLKFSSVLEKSPDDNQRNLIPLLIELANSQECRNLRRALASSRQTSEGGNRIDRRRSPRWHGEYLKLLSFNGARLRARDRCGGDSNCSRTKLVAIRETSSEKDPVERDGGEMANSAGRDREKSLIPRIQVLARAERKRGLITRARRMADPHPQMSSGIFPREISGSRSARGAISAIDVARPERATDLKSASRRPPPSPS